MNFPETVKNHRLIENFARAQAEVLNRLNSDYYIINGDIAWDLTEIDRYLKTFEKYYKGKVLRTLGNHCLSKNYTLEEYLNFDSKDYLPTNPLVLEDRIIIGNSGFFDLSFRTNYENLAGKQRAEETILKEMGERYFKAEYSMEEIAEILPTMLEKSRKQLRELMSDKNNQGKKIIFITHYLPSDEFLRPTEKLIGYFKDCFMGSNKIKEFLDSEKVDYCYFGHTHRRLPETRRNNTVYVCSAIGRLKEWEKWNYKNLDLFTQWQESLIEI